MSVISAYFQKLFRLKLPDGKVRQQAYEEITRSLNKAFALPSLKAYAATLTTSALLSKAVEMFVGSRAVPKNIELSRFLINVAESRSTNPKERDQIEYYKYFFIRIDAFKTGKTEEFDMTSEVINRLAEEKQHPQSCYLAGKQIMNVAMSASPEQRKEMFQLAAFYFQKSLTEINFGGLYYLGEIFRNEDHSEISEEEVQEFFVYGAALGDPLCYFRLSQIYLRRGEKKLYLDYLKLAAESGVIQAQHNFACEYLEGKNLPKDEIKALSWFLHAGANGYVQSKFNVVQLFLHGSTCGRIKRNPKVALVKLQELKSSGEAVDEKIQELLQNQDIKKLMPQSDQK